MIFHISYKLFILRNLVSFIYYYSFLHGLLICNKLGLNSIISCIKIILPLTLITLIFSNIGLINDFDLSNFTPILGKDLKTTFFKGITNIFSFNIFVYFYFINKFFKEPKEFNFVIKRSYIISFILLLITTIPILNLYTNTNNSESINYLYLISRNITFGNFINRVDAIFILVWIFLILTYGSISIYMIRHLLQKLFNIQKEQELSYISIFLITIICILPLNISNFTFLINTIYKYAVIIIGFMYPLSILILANFKYKYMYKHNFKFKNNLNNRKV